MKNFQNFLLVIILAVITLNLNAQTAGAAYPIVENATYSATAPCSVCSPWQFVQADSTIRRYIGGAWTMFYDPNAVVSTGVTNLSVAQTSTNVTVVSDTGTNGTIPAAQPSSAGVMSGADKAKLDGLAGFATQVLTSGNLTVIVDRYGTSPVTLTVNATGDYTVVVPATTRIDNISIHGDDTTLSSGSFIFRIDNSANSADEKMMTQMYNTATGGLVNVFSQGNNHTRAVSGNIVSDTFPNMSPFGGTGFDIIYR